MRQINPAKIKKKRMKDGSVTYWFKQYFGVKEDGKPDETTRRGFKSIKEAEIVRQKLILDKISGSNEEVNIKTGINSKTIYFKDFAMEWFQEVYIEKDLVQNTIVQTDSQMRNYIIKDFGDFKLNEITLPLCQKKYSGWVKEYENHRVLKSLVERILTYAVQSELLENNKMLLVENRSKKTKKEKIYYSEDEIDLLFATANTLAIPEESIIGLWIMFETGARIGEALALTWEDIDFETENVTLSKTALERKVIPGTKSGKQRIVPLSLILKDILLDWKDKEKALLEKHGFIFSEKTQIVPYLMDSKVTPVPPNRIRDAIRKMAIAAGLPPSGSHVARRSFANRIAKDDSRLAQHLLGHSSLRTTEENYLNPQPKFNDADRAIMNRLPK